MIQINVCPPRCGDKHDWTGPWIQRDSGEGSVTCAKCGMAKIDFDIWMAP
jgi:hypothetical protein